MSYFSVPNSEFERERHSNVQGLQTKQTKQFLVLVCFTNLTTCSTVSRDAFSRSTMAACIKIRFRLLPLISLCGRQNRWCLNGVVFKGNLRSLWDGSGLTTPCVMWELRSMSRYYYTVITRRVCRYRFVGLCQMPVINSLSYFPLLCYLAYARLRWHWWWNLVHWIRIWNILFRP